MTPMSLEQLKEMQKGLPIITQKKEDVKLLADEEIQEDTDNLRECIVCNDLKPFDEFDSSDKICEECWEDNLREEKLKSEKEDPETKKCTKCQDTKPVTEFYHVKKGTNGIQYESHCKKCKVELAKEKRHKKNEKANMENPKQTQQQTTMEKKALEAYDNYKRWMRQKGTFTVKDMTHKSEYASSTTSTMLNVLAKKKLLDMVKVGKVKHYSLHKKEPIEFEGPKDMPVETKAKVNMPCNLIEENIFDKNKLKGNPDFDRESKTFTNLNEQPKENIIDEVIEENQKKIDEKVDKFGYDIENSTMDVNIPKTQQERLMDLVDIAYPDAESIQINPQTHEINIKMKVV
jgi:hypothetical protein